MRPGRCPLIFDILREDRPADQGQVGMITLVDEPVTAFICIFRASNAKRLQNPRKSLISMIIPDDSTPLFGRRVHSPASPRPGEAASRPELRLRFFGIEFIARGFERTT